SADSRPWCEQRPCTRHLDRCMPGRAVDRGGSDGGAGMRAPRATRSRPAMGGGGTWGAMWSLGVHFAPHDASAAPHVCRNGRIATISRPVTRLRASWGAVWYLAARVGPARAERPPEERVLRRGGPARAERPRRERPPTGRARPTNAAAGPATRRTPRQRDRAGPPDERPVTAAGPAHPTNAPSATARSRCPAARTLTLPDTA